MIDRWSTRLSVALLAVLAYVPALASSPGRMPADTKLYLYLEPGDLIGRAASTFEREQFAGWVPHQQITYLWPSGPWFWFFESIAVPDWIAHRLWIGTIMFAAGTGVWWLARQLRLVPVAALAAGVVYQTSPYLLAYVSRTSLLLLPWAGLGWIVALTVRATRRPPDIGWRRRWFEPAAIALIVATIGSTNATALVLIAPAPALWLVRVAIGRHRTWSEVAAFAARTALLSTAASLWWAAMLVVQARHGAPVLAYSETLADVSRSSTGSEVVRGLGYWLFYVRDAFGPTTSASWPYLTSGRAIAISYAVTLVGLIGIAFGQWGERAFAAWLAVIGVVLAVGVHPITSSSPLMSAVLRDDESGLALALRSSTRAAPLFVLGIALGTGALVASLRMVRPHLPAVGGVAVSVLAIANLPALWQTDLVDPAIDRDASPPVAWSAAAAALDERGDGFRVVQLPGAEFGAFDWGYTVDQPLVALTDRPVVTRDLLPLGSAAAMDLLYALDDRVQEGTLEPASVAPVSRLFGADVIWLANDLDALRFRTPAPSTVDALLTSGDVDGLGDAERFGDAALPTRTSPVDAASLHVTQPGAPSRVALVPIEDPEPVVRAKTETVILSGSGDGIVDAAAAGLLTGHELIRYSASFDAEVVAVEAGGAAGLIVTDSNRDRAHHWRSSQDVVGHTEPGGPSSDLLVPTAADQRLAVFDDERADQQTVAVQRGPVSAVASSYGEPFAYRPEDRAVMAIDGDPTTAWRVGDHGDPVGASIRLVADASSDSLVVHQVPPPPGGRRIATISVAVGEQPARAISLDEASFDGRGQQIAVDAPAGTAIEIVIEAITVGDPARRVARSGVGFSELDLGLGPTVELIRPPLDLLTALDGAGADLSVVLTRLRTAPTDPWRADPEPALQRILPLAMPIEAELTATLRLDARAADALIADATGIASPADGTAVADRRLVGSVAHRGSAAVDGDDSTAWVTPFDDVVGATLDVPISGPVRELVIVQPSGAYSPITELVVGDVVVPVPAPDLDGRSTAPLPAAVNGDTVTITISAIEERTAIERRYGDRIILPAAIAELTATDGIDTQPVDRRAVVAGDCTGDLLSIDGAPVPLRFSTTVGALLDGEAVEAHACDGRLALGAGEHEIRSTGRDVTGFTVDRIVLRTGRDGRRALPGPATVDVLRDDDQHRTASVSCPAGCWFVLGEGYNPAWEADSDGSLGRPQMVDGGFNGWWIEPTTEPRIVDVRWSAQRPVTAGLAISLLALIACLILLAAHWLPRFAGERPAGRRPQHEPLVAAAAGPDDHTPAVAAGLVLASTSLVVIGPWWALAALGAGAVHLLAGALAARLRRPWLRHVGRFDVLGVAMVAVVAVAVILIERREHPFPDAGWTLLVDHLNGLAIFAMLLVGVGRSGGPLRRLSDRVSARRGTGSRTAADAA